MNPTGQRANATAFRDLHRGPKVLVLPNPRDCASARLFEQAGFLALATMSGGVAAVLGYPDGEQIRSFEMLAMGQRNNLILKNKNHETRSTLSH